MAINVNLKGFADLNRRLEKISKEEATKAGQIANRAGANILKKEVIKTAPNSPKTTEGEKRTRHTKSGSTREETHHKIINSVRVKKTKADSTTKVQNSVAIVGAYHATFVEFGSIHNTADPFMLRALEASDETIIETIARILDKQLVRRGA